jgi:hypothetical protein
MQWGQWHLPLPNKSAKDKSFCCEGPGHWMPTQNKACWYDMVAATVPFTKLIREHFHLWISARGFCEGLKIVIAKKYSTVIFPGKIKLEQVWYIKYWKFNTFIPLNNTESQECCKSCFATVALQRPQPYLDKLNLLQTLNVGLWCWLTLNPINKIWMISSHVGRWQGSWCQHFSNSWVISGLK